MPVISNILRGSSLRSAGARTSTHRNSHWKAHGQLVKEIWRCCSKDDHYQLLMAFGVSLVALGISAIAPLSFAAALNKSAQTQAEYTIAFMLMAFLAMRFIGQALTDFRWRLVNPVLYRIVYRFCIELCRRFADQHISRQLRTNSMADLGESVATIEKAQNGLMTVSHHFVVLVMPVLIEAAVMIVISAYILGWASPLLIIGAVIASAVPVLALRGREITTLQSAYAADNVVFREMGQVIGLSTLIRELNGFSLFEERLKRVIESSTDQHRRHFHVKTQRALIRTCAAGVSYGVALGIPCFQLLSGKNIQPGELFLLLAYMDRLMSPIGNLAVAAVGIENQVGLLGAEALFANKQLRDRSLIVDTNENGDLSIMEKTTDGSITLFELSAGKRALIRGLSGAGKTTFLSRIYDDLRSFEPAIPMAYLSETPAFFEGSVGENLLLHASADLREHGTQLWCEFWKRRLGRPPPSLHQMADSLSGGEGQLLAFLRAALRRPKFIFIDEGLSAMDPAMETAVIAHLSDALSDCTVFLVSHRPIVCFEPDLIVDVAQGQAVVTPQTS